jgi:hypothetical protein
VRAAEPLQVVLGEADSSASLLRFVLEGEGFHIVGMAGCDDDLLRVLAGARPSAVVLDAGISAPAALEVRERYPDVPLVLVWPRGVVAVLTADRVDPAKVITELGAAVRRAAARAAARRALDAPRPADPVARPPLVDVRRAPAAPRRQPTARARPVSRPTAFIAAVAVLYVFVGASVAFGLPYALHHVLQRPVPAHGLASPLPTVGAAASGVAAGPQETGDRPDVSASRRPQRTDGRGRERPPTPSHRPDRQRDSKQRPSHRSDRPATPAHPSRSDHPTHTRHPGEPAVSQRPPRGTGA